MLENGFASWLSKILTVKLGLGVPGLGSGGI